MKKKATFDSVVNANNAITIPEATRIRLGIVPGDTLTVMIQMEAKE